ncbi:MAG TPA: methionyl-tRNA formyltransferase [Acidimicrobiia bacterium]
MTARVVFMGTPEAALPTLETLTAHHDVALVVTQPDRPRGRSGRPAPSPVKTAAEGLGIQVAQPKTRADLHEAVSAAGPFDVGVVVAYGRILREEVLELPAHGLLNVHFSLLPRWRGAAPVARALLAGDRMTGITIIRLDEGLDTGPVLTAQGIDVHPDENAGQLTERLATIGARLLAETLPSYLSGDLIPVAQSDEGLTYAAKIEPGERRIDPSSTIERIVDQVRALAPAPAATLDLDGTIHKVYEVRPAASGPEAGRWGSVDGRPVFGANDGWIELVSLQTPGRERQAGADWLRGRRSDGGVVG